jgi:L-fuconate dehydratase
VGRRIVTEYFSALDTYDVRFPTSLQLDGSDAMNPQPDYSAAYVVLRTSEGREGYGLTFTVGRGNDVQVAGIRALAPLVVGQPVARVVTDIGAFSRSLTGDSQLRWLGPDKGLMHMAASAVINAVWDLAARAADKPLWRLLADLSPDDVVAQVDFRYLRDALTEREAFDLLTAAKAGRADRERLLPSHGYPAYTTTPDDVLGHAAVRRALASCRSTRAGSAASTRTSRSCSWPPSSGYPCARTRAASGCARWSSTSPCSISSRSAAPGMAA